MNKAVILHGTEGSSQSSWIPWLKEQLEDKRVQVWAPDLPNADYPSLVEWSEYVLKNCPFEIDEETTLIGHSAGAVAVLIVAQKNSSRVGQIISVASFRDAKYHQEIGFHANDRFFDVGFDFEAIKQNCTQILFIHSDNDPYCPLYHAEYLAEKTGGELKIIPGQKHFNLEADTKYKQFPELIELIS